MRYSEAQRTANTNQGLATNIMHVKCTNYKTVSLIYREGLCITTVQSNIKALIKLSLF
jgi:hypothetical protein